MVDSHICKTRDEINQTTDETKAGIGIKDIPLDARNKRLGSSSKKGGIKSNTKSLDESAKKIFKPKKKDDPFDSSNFKLGF